MSKTNRLIKKWVHKIRLKVAGFIITRGLWAKSKTFLRYALEVLITGIIVHYAVYNSNAVAWGLRIALLTYYTEWFVRLCKTKPEDLEQDGTTYNIEDN